MYPRTNYEMTKEDLQIIMDASKPVRAMMIGSYTPAGPQENANTAWERLGKKMGFDYMTVRPVEGKGNCFFTAVPSENEVQRAERLTREAEEKRNADMKKLKKEIEHKFAELEALEKAVATELARVIEEEK